jgi:hypothetical protein
MLATLLPVAAATAAAAAAAPKLSLGGLTVTLDASLPRAVSFGFAGHTFSDSVALMGSMAAPPPPPDAPCTSTKTYCPQLANCFQGCVDHHEAPFCYQDSCCPSKSFGAYNISSLGFYECRSTPCLANCTAVFAKGLPPVPPPPPVPPSPSPSPHPPPPAPPPPPPLDSLTLVQVGGRRSIFIAASNLTTTWTTASNGSSASWRLVLGTTATATGSVHLVADSDGHGSPGFYWSLSTLTDHAAPAVANQTRWLELGFGFASLSEAGGGYTSMACHSGKRPALSGPSGPNYADWSWGCQTKQGSVSTTDHQSTSLGVGIRRKT